MGGDLTAGNNGNGKVRGRPWKQGQSGNPAGRPKGSGRLGSAIRGLLDEPVTDEVKNPFTKKPFPKGTTLATALATITLARAVSGDKTALPLAYHYSDGLPKQQIDMTSGDGQRNLVIIQGMVGGDNGHNGHNGHGDTSESVEVPHGEN